MSLNISDFPHPPKVCSVSNWFMWRFSGVVRGFLRSCTTRWAMASVHLHRDALQWPEAYPKLCKASANAHHGSLERISKAARTGTHHWRHCRGYWKAAELPPSLACEWKMHGCHYSDQAPAASPWVCCVNSLNEDSLKSHACQLISATQIRPASWIVLPVQTCSLPHEELLLKLSWPHCQDNSIRYEYGVIRVGAKWCQCSRKKGAVSCNSWRKTLIPIKMKQIQNMLEF